MSRAAIGPDKSHPPTKELYLNASRNRELTTFQGNPLQKCCSAKSSARAPVGSQEKQTVKTLHCSHHVIAFPLPTPQKAGGQEKPAGLLSSRVPSPPPRGHSRVPGGAAPTVLTAGSTDARGAAAGARRRVAGPAVLAAAGEAAVLSKGVWRASCRQGRQSARVTRLQDSGPSSPSRHAEQPSRGMSHPIQKQRTRGTRAPSPAPAHSRHH